MGFLQVVKDDEMNEDKLAHFWGISRPKFIENGGKVIIHKNEVMVQVKNGRVVDVVIGAGGYVYHSGIEVNHELMGYADVMTDYIADHRDAVGNDEIVILHFKGGILPPDELRTALNLNSAGTQSDIRSDDRKTWKCDRCGTENDKKFCRSCGAPRPQTESQSNAEPSQPQNGTADTSASGVWKCDRCGTENDKKFCRSCGAPRPQNESQSNAEPSQPQNGTADTSASGVWKCDRCGTENDKKFCRSCGAPRPQNEFQSNSEPSQPQNGTADTSASSVWKCDRCGTENDKKFCRSCGAPCPQSNNNSVQPEAVHQTNRPVGKAKSNVIWICEKCGSKNEFSFCKSCGASRTADSEIYTEPAPAPPRPVKKNSAQYEAEKKAAGMMWVCKECGTKNIDNFCKKCGASR